MSHSVLPQAIPTNGNHHDCILSVSAPYFLPMNNHASQLSKPNIQKEIINRDVFLAKNARNESCLLANITKIMKNAGIQRIYAMLLISDIILVWNKTTAI